ncbi:MAG TPA: histidinol dehydrogenase, partial [Solirubrobacteraceae bacterium]|nr:histidinol dehydrogenase [Solirubrobacteraceae bacterium]
MSRYLKPPSPPSVAATDELQRRVAGMLREIEQHGIDAVRRYSRELDGWAPPSFVVSDEEFERAAAALDDGLRRHIAFAQEQVRTFAQAQRATLSELELSVGDGVVLGQRLIPVGSVGAYVPGGRYPMLASSFMTVLVAKVAGVERVIACAPPQGERGIHPAMLYAMRTSGADAVVCLGGVQALAALAFGLIDGLPPVDMLVGAGNAYVAEAKRQLFGRVGIDLLAGPTEVLVIADAGADPHLVAADLLGQAEHGPTSPAGAIAIGEGVGEAIVRAVEELLETWPTAEIAGEAWRAHGWVAAVADDDEAIRLADEAAYEHLEVHVAPAKL